MVSLVSWIVIHLVFILIHGILSVYLSISILDYHSILYKPPQGKLVLHCVCAHHVILQVPLLLHSTVCVVLLFSAILGIGILKGMMALSSEGTKTSISV